MGSWFQGARSVDAHCRDVYSQCAIELTMVLVHAHAVALTRMHTMSLCWHTLSFGVQLENADLLKGDSVAALATWSETSGVGNTCDMSALVASGADDVTLRVAFVDAELFSVRIACASTPSV